MWIGLLLNAGVKLASVGNGKEKIKMGRREDECGGRRGLGDTDLSLGINT